MPTPVLFSRFKVVSSTGALRSSLSLWDTMVRPRIPRGVCVLIALLMAWSFQVHAQNVVTEQNDGLRSGVQSQEALLTPANVDSADFGKVFSLPVLGHVYAQPLYVSGVTMSDGTTHNVLFVATEQDYVYAFDADGNNPAQGYLWRDWLVGAGETWVSYQDVNTGDIYPDIGITGTPVINPATRTLYVVAKSKMSSGATSFFQRLHALSLTDGSEKLNGPTLIQATVPGTGNGATTVSFNALLENQRPGLVLAPTPNGASAASVFISWASHGDNGQYHGWVIGYNAADVSQQSGVWCDSPNGSQGGIWMSGGALSTDGAGNIFGVSGNGTFDASNGGLDYGDSAFALSLTGSKLAPTTYFTPTKQSDLNVADNDMGVSSLVLLPTQTGPYPHLAITADKTGTIYVLNRDTMGGYSSQTNASLQSFSIGNYSMRTSVAFFNNSLYVGGEGAPISAWAFNPQSGSFATQPFTSSTATFGCSDCGGGGTTPSFSANGSANAILWTLDNSGREKSPAILRAYDPANLQHEFYDSAQAANNRDAAAIAVKFTTPVVANGRVYVGGINAVTVYGELHPAPTVTLTANPTSIAPGAQATLTMSATNATCVTVAGSDGSSYSLPATGGTQVVTPTADTTYTATASGPSGQTVATATVTISPVAISASPASIAAGQSSTLSVTATNATQLTVSGSDGTSYTLAPAGGSVPVTPSASTTYTATATTASGTVSAAATVTIVPAPTVTLVANPASISSGSSSVLTISATNASQVTVSGSDGSSYTLPQAGGNQKVSPTATVTYTASVTGTGGSASAAATVTVTPVPVVSMSASPTSVSAGGASTLTVTASNDTQLTVSGSDGSSYSLAPGGGSQIVTPASTTTYTATATGAGGTSVGSVTVSVASANPGGCLPTSPGAMICQPTPGTSVSSPATIVAGAKAGSGYVAAIRAYIDNIAVFTVNNPTQSASFQVSQAVTIAPGTHNLVIVAYQSTGGAVSSAENVTVGTAASGPPPACFPSAAGAMICSPAQNASITSTTQVLAGATSGSGFLTAIRLYVDNAAVALVNNPQQSASFAISQSLTFSPGSHNLAVVGYQSTGGAVMTSEKVTVGSTSASGGPCSSTSVGVLICSPAQNASVSSPVEVAAAAQAAGGYITAIRIYVDNIAQALVNNPQRSSTFSIDQSVALPSGSHYLVIVGYQSNGGAVRAAETISVD